MWLLTYRGGVETFPRFLPIKDERERSFKQFTSEHSRDHYQAWKTKRNPEDFQHYLLIRQDNKAEITREDDKLVCSVLVWLRVARILWQWWVEIFLLARNSCAVVDVAGRLWSTVVAKPLQWRSITSRHDFFDPRQQDTATTSFENVYETISKVCTSLRLIIKYDFYLL